MAWASVATQLQEKEKKRQDGWLDGTFNWLILRAKVRYSYFTNDNNEGKGQKVRHIRVRCVQGYTQTHHTHNTHIQRIPRGMITMQSH